MSKASRDKGKRGEREFAALLRSFGYEARRGVQYSGGADSPDIVTELPFHFEVKRVEKLNIHDAYKQAEGDAEKFTPVVAHKRSRCRWFVTLLAEDFLGLLNEKK